MKKRKGFKCGDVFVVRTGNGDYSYNKISA